MTKYILAGGRDRKYPAYFESLARIILAEKSNPTILSCWFSNNDKVAKEKFVEYKSFFTHSLGPDSTTIMADKTIFLNQVESCDVIYFHGGDTELLLKTMSEYQNLEKYFKNKVVVGSSAGANYLASAGYSPAKQKVYAKKGYVEVGCVVHYGSKGYNGMSIDSSQWPLAVEKVSMAAAGKPTILLAEGMFAVFEG